MIRGKFKVCCNNDNIHFPSVGAGEMYEPETEHARRYLGRGSAARISRLMKYNPYKASV